MNIFIKLRLLMLPLKQIDSALPKKGVIYEIGCGGGALANYLAQVAPERRIIGIDKDKGKITRANKHFSQANLSFQEADARLMQYHSCAGAVMSDFLHHVDYYSQEVILKKLTRIIKPSGVLVIKEIDRNDGILYLCTRLWDFLIYPSDKIYYRTRKDWVKLLTKMQFQVKASREVRWFPGSTHLFVCKKL